VGIPPGPDLRGCLTGENKWGERNRPQGRARRVRHEDYGAGGSSPPKVCRSLGLLRR
jgi:hypothetical protein